MPGPAGGAPTGTQRTEPWPENLRLVSISETLGRFVVRGADNGGSRKRGHLVPVGSNRRSNE